MTGATLPNQSNFTNAYTYVCVYLAVCLSRENMHRSSMVLKNPNCCEEVVRRWTWAGFCFEGSLGGFWCLGWEALSWEMPSQKLKKPFSTGLSFLRQVCCVSWRWNHIFYVAYKNRERSADRGRELQLSSGRPSPEGTACHDEERFVWP